jgi:thiol-disulfide isomerase/thioredoxin
MFVCFGLLAIEVLRTAKTVKDLTEENWEATIEKRRSEEMWFVMFYGSDCPACQYAAPEFVDASNKTQGLIQFGSVNTTEEQDLSQRLHIAYLPTFMIYYSGGSTDYTGGRSSEKFIEGISPYFKGCLTDFEPSWLNDKQNSAVLFVYNERIPMSWKIFSCNAKDIRVGYSTDGTLRHSLGAPLAPAAFLINRTHKVHFKDIPDAIHNARLFFSGKFRKPAPTLTLFLPFEIGLECKGATQLCVGLNADEPSQEFKAIALEFGDKNVKFFQGDDEWPTQGIKPGHVALFRPGTKEFYPVQEIRGLKEAIKRGLQDPKKIGWIKY